MKKRNLIGVNLKKYRKLNNLSQRDFVAKLALLGLNMDQTSLCRIENSCREVYDYELIYFCKALNISLLDLFIDIDLDI